MKPDKEKKERQFKHLSWNDRLKIERMLKQGYTNQEIADAVHVSIRTIFREKKRGLTIQRDSHLIDREVYVADIAQLKYEENLRAKGPDLKIGSDRELAEYLEGKIADEGMSPDAALMSIELEGRKFKTTISKWTLYSYIDKGIFMRLTNKDLPRKGVKKGVHREVKRSSRASKGESIENRPEEIDKREEFGHWEMDSVISAKSTTKKRLLTMTERKTRDEIIFLLPNGKTEMIVSAIDKLEECYGLDLFRQIFRTITVDNGSEFMDVERIQRSKTGDSQRTKLFFCHPYSSFERGTNENHNGMIRRKIPKKTDFAELSEESVKSVESWMNNYPRRILEGKTPRIMFDLEVEKLRNGGAISA